MRWRIHRNEVFHQNEQVIYSLYSKINRITIHSTHKDNEAEVIDKMLITYSLNTIFSYEYETFTHNVQMIDHH